MNNKGTLCKKRMLNKILIKRLSLYKKKLWNKVVVIKVWTKSLLSNNSLKCRGKYMSRKNKYKNFIDYFVIHKLHKYIFLKLNELFLFFVIKKIKYFIFLMRKLYFSQKFKYFFQKIIDKYIYNIQFIWFYFNILIYFNYKKQILLISKKK